MKKGCLFIFFLLAVCASLATAGIFIFNQEILNRTFQLAPKHIKHPVFERIQIEHIQYDSVKLNKENGLTLTNLEIQTKLSLDKNESFKKFKLKLNTASLNISKENEVYAIYIEGNKGKLSGNGKNNAHEWLDLQHFKILVDRDELTNRGFWTSLPKQINTIITNSSSTLSIDATGIIHTQIYNNPIEVAFYTENSAQGSNIRLSKRDLYQVAMALDSSISEEELEMLSNNPARAPAVLNATYRAKLISLRYWKKNKNFPKDACRHILWSYYLTKNFGEEYAEKVTSAHETIPGNTNAERQMDFKNNETGRLYAKMGLSEQEVIDRVVTSPLVIRKPEGH